MKDEPDQSSVDQIVQETIKKKIFGMEVYITGTTNQQAQPNIAFQTMIKILMELRAGKASALY